MKDGPAPPSPPSWYYRPWAVVLLLFLVLGPLGLPLLWKSPSFTRGWKFVLTVAMGVYTALLVESVVVAVRLAMEQLNPS
jgi:hypothetical protein